jgi:hypothetical protein
MRGEDKIFLMEMVLATLAGGEAFIRLMANTKKVDRILAIRNELGRDGFDAELINLKKEMTYDNE